MPPKPESSNMVLNALAGIVAMALLSGVTWLISQSIDSGKHLVKIDTLLEIQSNQVPKLVEDKLAEIRQRDAAEFGTANARISTNEARVLALEEEMRVKRK